MSTVSSRRGLRAPVLSTRSAVVAGTVAVVVLAVLATGVVVGWRAVAEHRLVDERRAEITRSAGSILHEVFSVHRDNWEKDRARARTLVAGEFAAGNATELTRPLAAGLRAVSWTPEVVAVTDSTTDTADALVRARVTTTPVDGPVRSEDRSVTARFERSDDRWKLARVEVLQ